MTSREAIDSKKSWGRILGYIGKNVWLACILYIGVPSSHLRRSVGGGEIRVQAKIGEIMLGFTSNFVGLGFFFFDVSDTICFKELKNAMIN